MTKTPLLLLSLLVGSSGSLLSSRAQAANAVYVPHKKDVQQYQPLSIALVNLEKKHKASIMFDSKRAENIKVKLEAVAAKESLETCLNKLLTPVNLNYKKINDKFYVINFNDKVEKNNAPVSKPKEFNNNVIVPLEEAEVAELSSIADVTITGTVTDESGETLPGVSVLVKGTKIATSTNTNGKYTIKAPAKSTLVFSYIGYVSKEVALGTGTVVNVKLASNNQKLDDVQVVAVGYGTVKKRNLTGAVASISAQAIKDMPMTNFENAIQGQMAGVQVQEPSGEPGSATTIRIRGMGSISAGNEPLYVVDGFPVSKDVSSTVMGDVGRRAVTTPMVPSNPLGTIAPGDIQSIEVLKDAAAASIYGSRGSNGVVIITTKKGRRDGTAQINFDMYAGVQTLANKLDLMNAREYAEFVKDSKNGTYLYDFPNANPNDNNLQRRITNGGTGGNLASYLIYDQLDLNNLSGVDTDWQDVTMKNAGVQSYNLSLSGGNEKVGYYVAGNYFQQDGIIDKTGFKRYSLRINLEANPTNKLKVGVNLNPSFTDQAKGSTNAPYFADPPGAVYSAIVQSPTVSPYLPDGSINQSNNQSHLYATWPAAPGIPASAANQGGNSTAASNPLAIINYIHDDLTQFRTFANAYAEYSIFKDLKYKLMLGADINNYNRSYYREKQFILQAATEGVPYGQSNTNFQTNYLIENTLDYSKTFGKHNLSVLAGYTAQKSRMNLSQIQAEKFPDDLVHTISGGQVTGGSQTVEEWALASMLGRVNYVYNDRYLLSATIRTDRASRFGADNKQGYFPSVSAGWRIIEENFMKKQSFISDAKLRASWGKTGNFMIPNYAAYGLLLPNNYVFGNTVVNGLAPSTMDNKLLTWEKNVQTNIGLDLGFLNNRIMASFDWYNKITSDLLLNVQIPAQVGFGTLNPLVNIGEVRNRGFEFVINTANLTGEFKWNTDFNFSKNENIVTKLGESGDPIYSTGGAGIRHVTQVGAPIGSYFGYVMEGIYKNQADINASPVDRVAPGRARPGDIKFKDVNGDGQITTADRTIIGNYQPKFTWGITNKFNYKNIDLSFLIQGVEGSEVLNLTRRHLANGEGATNSYAIFNNRWKSEQDPGDGKTPRADRLGDLHNFNNRPSSFQVEDASYIRLRNVTIGYNLSKSAFAKYFSNFRIYASGTNLFTSTKYIGYNPEVNSNTTNSAVQGEDYGAYPLTMNFTFGINATFK
jgi:TonB-linked SusC/RagA family outer membrane protein